MLRHAENQQQLLERYRPVVYLPEGTVKEVVIMLAEDKRCLEATQLLFGVYIDVGGFVGFLAKVNWIIFIKLGNSSRFASLLIEMANYHYWANKYSTALKEWSIEVYPGEFLIISPSITERMFTAMLMD